ncbi:hypothetical protein BH23PLA1_BH23PLA1_01150 [soil metagenome]
MSEPEGANREGQVSIEPPTRRPPRLIRVHRRGPILRPSHPGRGLEGIYGIDLTAGCGHACSFCHVRGSALFPGEGRILFDPSVVEQVEGALDELPSPPRLIVLSPWSDPLPPIRAVREVTLRLTRRLLERGLEVLTITRGRVPKELITLLAEHRDRARVAIGLTTLSRPLARVLEPLAPAPGARLKGFDRLVQAAVPVEIRLEPLIPGLTDTRENLAPMFRELARIGARRVVAHYLFQHPAILSPLKEALGPLGHSERLTDDFEGGPVFPVGSLGLVKHYPRETRREGLARLIAWGAEHGLIVETGSAQNPDLPRLETNTNVKPPVALVERRSTRRAEHEHEHELQPTSTS